LERLTGKIIEGEDTWRSADELLDRERPGDFNQAMMELGATTCVPRGPLCMAFPVMEFCAQRGELQKERVKQQQKKRENFYSLNVREGSVLMVQRATDASLMPGMWELPELATWQGAQLAFRLKHSITVTDYTVKVASGTVVQENAGKWVVKERLNSLPLTG